MFVAGKVGVEEDLGGGSGEGDGVGGGRSGVGRRDREDRREKGGGRPAFC